VKFGKCRHCRKPGCHPARPKCRAMRKVKPNQRVCNCGNYGFPHRVGSPLCASNVRSAELMWVELEKPRRKAG
jgi:hypothetical protein